MTDRPLASPTLEACSISKTYRGGTQALRDVSLQVKPGVVHGLVGANGAGKSTLIKIISGAERPSDGVLRWQGNPVDWKRPSDALAAGVAVVHQQSPVAPGLTVLENVYLGDRSSLVWRPTERKRALDELCERIGFSIDASARVAELSIGDRQMVSILRALATGASLLLLDEPTASISPAERSGVLAAARTLARTGTVAVLFVSHFLNEVMQICDTVTVLRDGAIVDEFSSETMSVDRMVDGIVGRKLRAVEASRVSNQVAAAASRAPVLQVRELASVAMANPVSFEVRPGEIVGIAGLLGSGRTSLLKAIFGADRRSCGAVLVDGHSVAPRPAAAVKAGVAYVPEDRMGQGLVGDWEIWRNISMSDLGQLTRGFGLLNPRKERARAMRAVAELGVATPSIDTLVKDLSGGNAQKVVFAKWIYKQHHLLLLDEPTAGVDVGGKADLIKLIRDLAARGTGVVVVLSEFEELLSVADRVLVLRHGSIVAEFESDAVSVSQLTASVGGIG